jgi:hypothetical protein
MVAAFLPARAIGKIFSTHFARVPTIPETPAKTMVNGDVMGTAFAPVTLPFAAGTRHAVGAVSRQIPLLLMP